MSIINCCECGAQFDVAPDGGLRCELCAQENWVRWLVNLGETVRDGEPDGHTPAMRPGQREEHNMVLKLEKVKLDELRKRFPERVAAYKAKCAEDWRAAPWEINVSR